jgi:hypothetical protein
MSDDLGFSYSEHKNGDIIISRHGMTMTTLQAMARATGSYRRGNERR